MLWSLYVVQRNMRMLSKLAEFNLTLCRFYQFPVDLHLEIVLKLI